MNNILGNVTLVTWHTFTTFWTLTPPSLLMMILLELAGDSGDLKEPSSPDKVGADNIPKPESHLIDNADNSWPEDTFRMDTNHQDLPGAPFPRHCWSTSLPYFICPLLQMLFGIHFFPGLSFMISHITFTFPPVLFNTPNACR
jgi:hypothetical protein